ncbi:MAG: hypothetical protein ACYDHU_02210 [Acidimicrobiales bacterium]
MPNKQLASPPKSWGAVRAAYQGGPRSTGTGILSPTPEPDLARVVEILYRHGVEYLTVGGHAARAYGATRHTKDSDCLVRSEKENLNRLAAALWELNARLCISGLADEESAAPQCRSTPS